LNDLDFKIYPINEHTHKLVSANRHRDWQKENPFVFKCRPLNNASCFGWDLLCAEDIEVSWNGDTSMHDVTVDTKNGLAITNFGHGTFTFVVGYTFHTSPGWSIFISPVPNTFDQIFTPFSALVETDELKYPLFVTVRINTPGKYLISKGTPICRLIPVFIKPVICCEPVIDIEPDEFVKYRSWQATQRKKFQSTEEFQKIKNSRPYCSEKIGWQKFYDKIAKFPIFKCKKIQQ